MSAATCTHDQTKTVGGVFRCLACGDYMTRKELAELRTSPPPGASAGREEPRGDPNCDDHDGFGPNGECSRCTGLIQKDNGALIDHYGNVVRTVTYSADFISREFARYQQSGCRDQSIRDNMPFFVESLLSALAAERAAGEALPDFRDAYRSEVDKALAKGLRQEVAHELGLFATYLVGKAAGRAARALAADREEPYPNNPGQTHYEGCWRVRGHHNCAVAEVTALRSALREVQGEFLEAHAMIREVASRSSTPPGPCICARCREYRALAADRERDRHA